jgi:hypothetical protein
MRETASYGSDALANSVVTNAKPADEALRAATLTGNPRARVARTRERRRALDLRNEVCWLCGSADLLETDVSCVAQTFRLRIRAAGSDLVAVALTGNGAVCIGGADVSHRSPRASGGRSAGRLVEVNEARVAVEDRIDGRTRRRGATEDDEREQGHACHAMRSSKLQARLTVRIDTCDPQFPDVVREGGPQRRRARARSAASARTIYPVAAIPNEAADVRG